MDKLLHLKSQILVLKENKSFIVSKWMRFSEARDILIRHNIDHEYFIEQYANNVFEYFISVIAGEVQLGRCPVIINLLEYLKGRNIRSTELYTICSNFKLAMVEVSYDVGINTKELIREISYVFDKNFSSILETYSGTIYEKELELGKNVGLLEQYIYALNESALVSKTDASGKIIHVNKKFIDLCGYSQEELLGQTHAIMRHCDMSKPFFKRLWETIEADEIFRATIKNQKKDGEHFYIDTTIIPIKDPFSEKKEYMAIGYEVTKLVDARQRAIDADKAKDYFLSNMSHEIRTPLNAILGFVSILIDENISLRHKNYLDIVYKSGSDLLYIINDILDFSKLKSGEFTIEPQTFNLEDLLAHTMELFVASATKQQISIISYIDPTIPSLIYADSLRLGQIISNFISNAIKFTSAYGTIEVNASYEHQELKVSVKDSGIGIAQSDIEKIFDAFAQAQSSTLQYSGGSGLGLSICKQLAQMMDGRVEVVSQLGVGSEFTLVVPVIVANNDITVLDCKMLRDKQIAFYINNKTDRRKLEIFQKYYDQIGLKLHIIHTIEDQKYDLMYFMDKDLDNKTRTLILEKKYPVIAVMDYMDNSYESYDGVYHLCFPVYLTKLRDKTLDALDLGEEYTKQRKEQKSLQQFQAHLLVAEDNEANVELMKIILDKYGITYDIAINGVEALEMSQSKSYDLIIMDDQMPLMNGLESIYEIRKIEAINSLARTPICILTANVIKGRKELSLEKGCDYFLKKPIVLKELERVFKSVLLKKTGLQKERFSLVTLQEELQLTLLELEQLFAIYCKKMDETLPLLKNEIEQREYINIAKLAHSIKGSSANFRLKELQELSHILEIKAQEKNQSFDFQNCLVNIQKSYEAIKNFQSSM